MKYRILHFSLAKSMGGRSQYILDLWRWIDRNVFQIDFVTFDKEKLVVEDKIIEEGSIVHHLPCYPKENWHEFEHAWNNILDYGYDLVHIGTSRWDGFYLEELTYKRGIKIIVHSHTAASTKWMSDEERRNETEIHERLRETIDFGVIDGFWACSRIAAKWLFGDRVEDENTFITYPCIEVDRFRFNASIREKVRGELSVGEDTYLIGTVGRLVPIKNQSFLIRLFAQYAELDENTNLLIVGGGELEASLKQLAEELGVYNKCKFIGNVYDSMPYYMAMDVFLLTSFSEGFPRVIMEAVSSGLTAFCSEALPDEIDRCGNVFRMPLDVDVFNQRLIEHKNAIRNKRIHGIEIMKENGLDIKQEIHRIEREYLRLLSR